MDVVLEKMAAVAVVKRQMALLAPIPQLCIEQLVEQVAQSFPDADRNLLYPLLLDACIKEWSAGTLCC